MNSFITQIGFEVHLRRLWALYACWGWMSLMKHFNSLIMRLSDTLCPLNCIIWRIKHNAVKHTQDSNPCYNISLRQKILMNVKHGSDVAVELKYSHVWYLNAHLNSASLLKCAEVKLRPNSWKDPACISLSLIISTQISASRLGSINEIIVMETEDGCACFST